MTDLNPIQQSARDQFDRQSEKYGSHPILKNLDDVDDALKRVPFQPGDKALDVAAGAGHTGLHLAGRGFEVTLGDLSPGMLEQAKIQARERGLKIETRIHSAESIPFADGTFDLVICRVAAHHFSDPEAFLLEAVRVLKQGGHFILIDGTVEDGHPEAEKWIQEVEKIRDPSHHRFVTPGDWRRFCGRAGLAILDCKIEPLKQPDLNWYFEIAGTPEEARKKVLDLVEYAPQDARQLFRLGREQEKVVWWWQRLTLVAKK